MTKQELASEAPLFSIITTTFNAGPQVLQAIESVRRQGRNDVEFIIVDGGSRDDTLDIVRANSDVVTKVISERDDGIYDAINKGIHLSTGTLIGVLGADDAYEDGALTAVAEAFAAERAEIYAGRTRMIEPGGAEHFRADEAYGIGALVSGIPFGHNAMFAHREAYAKIGLYDTTYRLCADAHWVHRAIKGGARCRRLDQALVRFSLGGSSSVNPDRILEESDRTIQENFPFLSAAEARQTLYSVRGWAEDRLLAPILERHPDPDYRRSLQAALAARPVNPVQIDDLFGPAAAVGHAPTGILGILKTRILGRLSSGARQG